jgi:methyl-accepting chemotaxis protein
MSEQPITAYNAIQRVAESMMDGRLDERCNLDGHTPQDAELLLLVNHMLDSLIAPMRLAGTALNEIAHGRIPPFVIDDYKGEYNLIKQNINTLLAILYGMHKETTNLTDSVREGNLKTRGNDWDYDGIWKELIRGMNGTLDAVLDPVNEAGNVLGRLANYDLSARMRGRYHGDHAVIRKAMNTTAEALHGAISQVSETVDMVSEVGRQISEGSSTVANGATEQSHQLAETSSNLERIAGGATVSSDKTTEAKQKVHEATESMEQAQEAMERMLGAMVRIREAAENTTAIVNEIDGIAKETGTLSTNALDKANRIRTSAGGFGVVAFEIRKLGQRCTETAKGMRQFSKQVTIGDSTETEKLRDDFQLLIDDLEDVAMFSNLLGVNAAIEAAHVEGAGNDFRVLTDEIHNLASRSADAAKRTEQMTRSSLQLSRSGEELSRDINRQLKGAVDGARTISLLTDEISQATQEQATGIDQINQAVSQINLVTQKNADSAAQSSEAAQGLERQVDKLTTMVQKFRLEAAPVNA